MREAARRMRVSADEWAGHNLNGIEAFTMQSNNNKGRVVHPRWQEPCVPSRLP